MAACGRTVLVWSLLRGCGQRGCAGVGRTLSAGVGPERCTVWRGRGRGTWAVQPALNPSSSSSSSSSTLTWSLQRRALSSEAPYKEDEYPPLPKYTPSEETDTKEVFIVRVKGLPFSCVAEDLVKFFSECQIRGGVNGVHLMYNKIGKPKGEAFIQLEDEYDLHKALEQHRQYIGSRYIEVYEVTNHDAEAIMKGSDRWHCEDEVVRIRGLPFNCPEEYVLEFFSGLEVVKDGVTFVLDNRGRKSGSAYVQFANQEMANQALERNRGYIGKRYIEVFPSKKSEIRSQYSEEASDTPVHTQRTNRSSAPIHHVHMSGLPYQATARDIIDFFYPIGVLKVLIEYCPDGRPRGVAEVYFRSHQDALAAMSKDKECIDNRYIKLFLNSSTTEENGI